MTEYQRALRQFARDTAGRPDAIARLHQDLQDRVGPPMAPEVLREALSPAEGAAERVEHRLGMEIRVARTPRWPVVAALSLAAAAGAVWFLQEEPTAPKPIESMASEEDTILPTPVPSPKKKVQVDPPEVAEVVAPEPQPENAPSVETLPPPSAVSGPLNQALASNTWTRLEATEHVEFQFRGDGHLGGSDAAPRIDWGTGTLGVEVEPNQGIDLRVQTREATVRVVGTGFEVTRNDLGTIVHVRHGRVAVDCVDGQKASLGKGESLECLPNSAAGLLARARALYHQPAPAEEVLSNIDLALTRAPRGSSIEAELLYLRAEVLLASSSPDARTAIESFIASSPPVRRTEARRLAIHAAVEAGDCEAALLHRTFLNDQEATKQVLQDLALCAPTE